MSTCQAASSDQRIDDYDFTVHSPRIKRRRKKIRHNSRSQCFGLRRSTERSLPSTFSAFDSDLVFLHALAQKAQISKSLQLLDLCLQCKLRGDDASVVRLQVSEPFRLSRDLRSTCALAISGRRRRPPLDCKRSPRLGPLFNLGSPRWRSNCSAARAPCPCL